LTAAVFSFFSSALAVKIAMETVSVVMIILNIFIFYLSLDFEINH
tara:strand:- start:2479 stop:2613 length:135 start_codon:yes stop_codon:yes gene_type:complete